MVSRVIKFKLCQVICKISALRRISNKIPNVSQKFEAIPGPKSYPIIGTLYKYLPFIGEYNAESMHKTAELNYRRYGDIVREEPGVRLVHLYDPDHIEYLFRQDDRFPNRRSHVAMFQYRVSKPSVYNTGGLISTNGPDWWRLRKAFQKNFTSPNSVKGYVALTDQVTNDFIKWIKNDKEHREADFLIYLNRLNLEVIGAVAFNERFNSFCKDEQHPDSRSSKIIDAAFGSNSGIMKLDKGFLWRFFQTPLYRTLVKSQEYLEKISDEILLKKVRFFKNTELEPVTNSLIDNFLQLNDVDIKDIRGMMVDILMAAIDTTSYATSFALYHLARNTECQQKAFEEIATLVPSNDSTITPEIITKASYIRCCVKESLRLNPVAIGVGRLLQKDIIIKDYEIPKGTVVVTQNMVASNLIQYVKHPSVFNPERWLRGSSEFENIHPFLTLPFGFGPRSCIARRLAEQNIIIALIRIIQEFEIKWKSGNLGVKTHLINKPDKPLSFEFIARENCKKQNALEPSLWPETKLP